MIYSFGNCELDSEAYELYREGQKVDIERRVFDILLYLLQNPGRLISRDELFDNCWPGMHISNDTLTTSLGRVRRAIGQDQQKSDEIIKTVRGKGYRFLAEVSERPNQWSVKEPEPLTAAPTQAEADDAELTAPTDSLKPISSTPTAADAVGAQKPAATLTEMRQLTVFNCILGDNQTLLATHDMEEVHEIMQSYYRITREVVERFDGYLVHHLQDTILVYFGYPLAHEDDAQRAIRCGLQLLKALAPYPYHVSIGIHSGPVITGQATGAANLTATMTGITPTIAERLSRLSTARDAVVIISEATARLSAGYFDWQPLEPLPISDQSQALQCYQVLTDKRQTRLQVNEALHGLTPYINRSAEQALLLERWAQARDGHGQTVLLSGDAGIGKSRLLKTLAQHTEIARHRWLECQCSPYHQNTPFYPLINLLVQLLQWQEDDNAEQRLQALEALLTTYQLPLNETVPLFANMLSLEVAAGRYRPLQANAPQHYQQLLECLLTLLLELQQQTAKPLLLVVEDLHWIDPSTLEFIDLLITQVPTLAILLVLTTRPEFDPSWSAPALVTPFILTRFNSNQVEQMLLRITDGKALPDTVLHQIVGKTDGVPLFIEEMVHSLLDSGQLQEVDQTFELTQQFDPATIPLTLKDSLMARLDRLGEAKEVARWGAVIGREFSYPLLAEVVPFDEAVLQQHLNELLDSGLVHRRGLARRVTYSFKHALVQDITYQSLLKRQRRQCHQRIAEVLENAFPERVTQQPELLAQHHEAAGQFKSALHYWQQAGYRAVKSSALQEALAHFSKGLKLLEALHDDQSRQQQELRLRIALGPVIATLQGQAAAAVEANYLRADQLCLQLDENEQRLPVLWGLWRYYLNRPLLQTAREVSVQLLTLTQHHSNGGMLLEAHIACSTTQWYLGHFEAAWHHADQARTLYQPDQHQQLAQHFGGCDPGIYGLSYLAIILWHLGFPEQARQQSQAAIQQARDLDQPYSLAFALNFANVLHLFLRDSEQARQGAEEQIVVATQQGFALWRTTANIFLAQTRILEGDIVAGMTQLQEGVSAVLENGAELALPFWLALLAEAHGDNGEIETGLELLNKALAIVERTDEGLWQAELYRLKGLLLLKQSADVKQQPQDLAEDYFRKALDTARHQQSKALELRAAISLARLWQTQHKHRDADALLSSVYGWFSEGFASADLQEAKSLLVKKANKIE